MATGGLRRVVEAGQRISQRYPTAVAALDDPVEAARAGQPLIIDPAAMRESGPALFEKNIEAYTRLPQLPTGRARAPETRLEAAIESEADQLRYLYDQYPEELRGRAKQWYDGANRFAQDLSSRYGTSLEGASGVLAALSPQKDWFMNASLADRVLGGLRTARVQQTADSDMVKTARRLFAKEADRADLEAFETMPFDELTARQKAMWVRAFDETHTPRSYNIMAPEGEVMGPALKKSGDEAKVAWGSLSEIGKAIQVAENPSLENISALMGQQHKVRNFYNNIVNPNAALENPMTGDVTIDTHAVGAGLLSPVTGASPEVAQAFGGVGTGGSAITGARGTYGFHADAYRRAATDLGLQPRELQSITWEAVRSLFPAEWKTKKNIADIGKVWDQFQNRRITLGDARDKIVELAGGIDSPDWARVNQAFVSAGIPLAAGYGVLAPEEAQAGPMGSLARVADIPTQRVFHGSPHQFDQFEMSRMGAGEGAQAYGEGMYTTSARPVAESYRRALSEEQSIVPDLAKFEYRGEEYDFQRVADEIGEGAAREVFDFLDWARVDQSTLGGQTSILDAQEIARQFGEGGQAAAAHKFLERFEDGPVITETGTGPGALYEVEIPGSELMLDYNKTMRNQPREVLDRLPELLESQKGLTGEEYYWGLGSPEEATATLRGWGVPGMRYQGLESGEENFVVFDDRMMNIIARNEEAFPEGMGSKAFEDTARGRAERGVLAERQEQIQRDLGALERELKDWVPPAVGAAGVVGAGTAGAEETDPEYPEIPDLYTPPIPEHELRRMQMQSREGVPQTVRPALSEIDDPNLWDDIRGVSHTGAVLGHAAITGLSQAGASLIGALNPLQDDEFAVSNVERFKEKTDAKSAEIIQNAMADPNTRRFLGPTAETISNLTGFAGQQFLKTYGILSENVPGYEATAEQSVRLQKALLEKAREELSERQKMGIEGAGGLLF